MAQRHSSAPRPSRHPRTRRGTQPAAPIRPEEAAAEAELLPWLHQRLGRLPVRTNRLAGVRQFLADLEHARTAYERYDQVGAEAALLAAWHACFAFGRPDLAVPFRVLAQAIRDIRASRSPHILRKGTKRGRGGVPKATLDWDITVTAASYLTVLIQEAGVAQEDAARSIARILAKKRMDWMLGQSRTSTWESLINTRDDISRGKCPRDVADRYHDDVSGLRRALAALPFAERERALVDSLDLFLSAYFAIPDRNASRSGRSRA